MKLIYELREFLQERIMKMRMKGTHPICLYAIHVPCYDTKDFVALTAVDKSETEAANINECIVNHNLREGFDTV